MLFFGRNRAAIRKFFYLCTAKSEQQTVIIIDHTRIRKTNKMIAKVAQLVEHDLAKVGVAGSSPVFRSNRKIEINCNGTRSLSRLLSGSPVFRSVSCPDGGMVDTKDLKSFGFTAVRVQVPLRVL